MTAATKSKLSVGWEFLKSVGEGVIIFLLTGILKYQKMTYDWQIRTDERLHQVENTNAIQSDMIAKRQEYEHQNDQEQSRQNNKLTFLFAHFGLPLIRNDE